MSDELLQRRWRLQRYCTFSVLKLQVVDRSKGDGKRTQEKQTLQKTPVVKDMMFEKPTKVSVEIFID